MKMDLGKKKKIASLILFYLIMFHIVISSKLYTTVSNNTHRTEIEKNSLGQNPLNISREYHFDNRIGAINDVVINDDLAYLAVHWGGLVILNISDKSNLEYLGDYYSPANTLSLTSSYQTSGLFYKDNIIYLADGINGLQIINVSNPENPEKISSYREESEWKICQNVFVKNDIIYLATNFYLVILNASDILNPFKISEFFYIGINDINIFDNYIFLEFDLKCIILNGSNLTNLDDIYTLENMVSISLAKNTLFTLSLENNISIYNISIFPNLVNIHNYSITTDYDLIDVCVNDNYLSISSTNDIIVYNISSLTNLKLHNRIQNLNWYYENDPSWIKRKITVDSNFKSIIYMIDYHKGLFIYNHSKENETELGYFNCEMKVDKVKEIDNLIYLISKVEHPYFPSRIEVLEIINSELIMHDSYIVYGNIRDYEIIDDKIIVLTSSSLLIIDSKDKTNLEYISSYVHYSSINMWNLFFDSKKENLYISCGSDGIIILDSSNMNNLSLLSEIKEFNNATIFAYDIFVCKNKVYITNANAQGGFVVVNIKNPEQPDFIFYLNLNSEILGIHIVDSIIYCIAKNPVLYIIDSDDYNIISEYNSLNGEPIGSFSLENNCLAISHRYNISLLNLTIPSNPQILLTINRSLSALFLDVYLAEGDLYIACAWHGLEIWNIYEPISNSFRYEIIFFILLSTLGTTLVSIIVLYYYKRRRK